MDTFLSLRLKPHQLEKINQVRLHLQVTFLSDILDPRSGTLLPSVWSGSHSDGILDLSNVCTSMLTWPTQPRPPPGAWEEWRLALSRTHINPDTQKTRLPMRTPWALRPNRHRQWVWSTDRSGITLCKQRGGKVFGHDSKRVSRTCWLFHLHHSGTVALPEHTFPTTVEFSMGGYIVEPLHCSTTTESTPTVESDPPSNLSIELSEIAEPTVIHIVSDGSCQDERGSFGWLVATQDKILH